ncbi:MAG TPA: hypothetical protein VEW04_02295 [Allosphingosinicella sp.]|nr:hypothetical protein [Allosphingosinicella sp.]
MRSSFVSALAAISLIAAPTASIAATSGSAAPLSIGNSPAARASAGLQNENRLDETGYILVGVGAVALIILFFVLIDDDDDSDSP